MRQWVVLSGKGGTGKTSLLASFARLAGRLVLADADVDAANLALALGAHDPRGEGFDSGSRARIDPERCTACGDCLEVCRYEAIREASPAFTTDDLLCEGCNACGVICPESAVTLVPNRAGELLESETPYGPLVHAELDIAQDNSGKLVAGVIERARQRAAEQEIDLVLVDAPPGIGCPVHAAVSTAQRILAVTEPTVSGHHDLERLLELAVHFKLPAGVAINRWDVAPDQAERIAALCTEHGVPLLGRIPFDRELPLGLCRGQHPLDAAGPETAAAIQALWEAWSAPDGR